MYLKNQVRYLKFVLIVVTWNSSHVRHLDFLLRVISKFTNWIVWYLRRHVWLEILIWVFRLKLAQSRQLFPKYCQLRQTDSCYNRL